MIRARSHAGGYDRLCVEGRRCVIHHVGSEVEGAARRSSGRLLGGVRDIGREIDGAEASTQKSGRRNEEGACIIPSHNESGTYGTSCTAG